MDWEQLLVQGATIAVTMGVVALITQVVQASARRTTTEIVANRATIRLHRLYLFMGWGCIAIALPYAILPFTDESSLFLNLLCSLMIAGFGGGGYYLLTYYYRHRLSWDREAFLITDRRGRSKTISWSDITATNYQPNSGFLLLFAGQEKHKVSTHMVGLRAFRIVLQEQTGLSG